MTIPGLTLLRRSPAAMFVLAGAVLAVTLVVGTAAPAAAADVNVSPVRTISNTSPTALNATFWVATPGDGFAYVASRGDRGGTKSLLVFDQSLSGNNTIVRSIPAVEDPTGVSVHEGLVYVANPSTGTVQVFEAGGASASNTALRTITGAGQPHVAVAARIGGTDYLYVADNGNNQVRVYLAGGAGTSNTLQHTLSGGLQGVQGLTVHEQEVFVVSRDTNEVRVFDADGSTKTSPKRVITGLNSPLGVVVEPSTDTLFVSNTGNNSVNAYPTSASGGATPTFRLTGGSTGLSVPSGMSLLGGNLYVTNWFTGTVTVFSAVPQVTSVAPTPGRPGGTVTITGSAFTQATSVQFGNLSVPFTVNSDTQITATVPTHPSGPADVTVSNPLSSGTGQDVYTYQSPLPSETVCTDAPQLVNGDFDRDFPAVSWNTTFFALGFKLINTDLYPQVAWRNTAESNIELIKSGANGQFAQSGDQYAELNASLAGTLYQDLTTTPGQTMRWSFYHRARNGDTPSSAQAGTNTMRLLIGTPGNVVQQGPDRTSPGTHWTQYTGTYTVPAGQTTTRFAFQSVSGLSPSVGNLLDSVSFTTADGCAAAPTNLSASPENGSVALSFTQSSDGGDPVTNYAYKLDSGSWTALPSADNTSPVYVSGLTNGQSYTIRIRAMNSTAAGFISDSVTVTPRTTPAAPTFTATRVTGSTADVVATPGGNGGAAITGYEYSVDGGIWRWAGSSTSFAVSGLTASTGHSLRVRATNAAGSGDASAARTVTKAVPEAPGGVSVRVTPGSPVAQAQWTPATANAAPVSQYTVQAVNGVGTVVRTCVSSTTRCTLGGLPTQTPLQVRVSAANVYGSGENSALSGTFSIAPSLPAAPTVKLKARSTARLTVRVQPKPGGPPSSYSVRAVGDVTRTCTVTGSTGTCRLTGLTQGEPYAVSARATNITGSSPWSAPRTFRTRS